MTVIALEGVNGCGKSTLIKALVEKNRNIIALNIKDEMVEDEALLTRFYERDTLGLADELVRSLLAAHIRLLEKAQRLSQEGHRVLLDRSIASFYVYQYYLSDRNRLNHQLYVTLLKPLERRIHYVWLDVALEALVARLHARGDPIEQEELYLRQEGYRHYFMQCDTLYTRYTEGSFDFMDVFFV